MKFNIGKIIVLLLLLIIFWAGFRHCGQSKQLSRNGELTQAEVLNVVAGTKASIYYKFTVNGRRYDDMHRALLRSSIRDSLLGRSFPLVYLKDNPTTHRFLLEESDFNAVGRRAPRQLQWVWRYKN
ncbi:hypothetical protein HB364_02365 [Pseudoflavitalea sp. X16]|uniref:hypothetical protein n=1 Tax=Paraflavitalea devenefica TaxID=2716334 RepID=UPI00141EF2E8|nr:hypothetical protein [Paraflavitalea devenefica]NII23907.1 hypothetical protein [Paraflavitalea devenefica]